jgi:hypothetical protein
VLIRGRHGESSEKGWPSAVEADDWQVTGYGFGNDPTCCLTDARIEKNICLFIHEAKELRAWQPSQELHAVLGTQPARKAPQSCLIRAPSSDE